MLTTFLKLKLAALAVVLALLPFSNTFACSCDGRDDYFTPQTDTQQDN